jgi:hypothetical protein
LGAIARAATRPPAHRSGQIGQRPIIGSVLRHEYHTISDKVIWDVVHADLPLLKTAIEAQPFVYKGMGAPTGKTLPPPKP